MRNERERRFDEENEVPGLRLERIDDEQGRLASERIAIANMKNS
jgi:hypothetical protein